jgi:transposase InsO family protein
MAGALREPIEAIPVVAAAVVPECENLDPRTLERTRGGASQSELGYDDSGGRLTPGKWGVAYGPTSVGRILRGLGLSRQKARPSHPKKDAAAEAFFCLPYMKQILPNSRNKYFTVSSNLPSSRDTSCILLGLGNQLFNLNLRSLIENLTRAKGPQ